MTSIKFRSLSDKVRKELFFEKTSQEAASLAANTEATVAPGKIHISNQDTAPTKGNSSSKIGAGSRSTHSGKGGNAAPKQTQAQINSARESNPNSQAYWQTRQLEVPSGNRVEAAKDIGRK